MLTMPLHVWFQVPGLKESSGFQRGVCVWGGGGGEREGKGEREKEIVVAV
jgi:hypothetical protein